MLFLKYMLCGVMFAIAGWCSVMPVSAVWSYGAINLLAFSVMFFVGKGSSVLGKNTVTGMVPVWSILIFWAFHLLNYLYLYAMHYSTRRTVPSVSRILTVSPNLYIGGFFPDNSVERWSHVLDLTSEFSEQRSSTNYLNIPLWDGNAPTSEQLEEGAKFLLAGMETGPTLCHCAFGIGRSTTFLIAALIVGGKAGSVKEALHLIRVHRPIVRVNGLMENALNQWVSARKKLE